MFKTQCSGLARIQGISEKEAVECEPKLTQFFHPKSCQFTYRYYPCRLIQIGFGGIRTHDILTPFKDWLRARRSAWLSYEPSETIHQLEIFKSKHLYGTNLTSLYLSDEGLRLRFIV